MLHFFRRTKLHLDCFTFRRDVIEYAPIVNASKAIPEWWKKLPKQVSSADEIYPLTTMKQCVGMQEYYTKSIALPLWSELCIATTQEGFTWQFSDFLTAAHTHGHHQYAGFLPRNEYGQLKIVSPWLFETKEDVSWLVTEPIYNRTGFKNYTFAQGVLNFYKQANTNMQIFIHSEPLRTFSIPFGTPFLLTPLTDKKVVIHRHLISEDTYKSKNERSTLNTFIGKYKLHQSIPKCPYKDETK